ncbi:autotransporter assembly complex protein TamA [Comamonas composti]|uniref:autotransporter assembly complex protein TamA n=1 Tax=Comamonas composti TaxID=408558 RepID=UPI00047C9DED|nr:BamA/TamA family outer membrane protein [Comamonas composti]
MPKFPPAITPARGSALLLSLSLMLGGCSVLSPKEKDEDAALAASSGKPVFSLEVDAPKEIRELLEKHLELQRYRFQSDLQRRELLRLLGATDANVRDLIGTLGYFSPTVTVEVKETPEADAPRQVTVKVDPGEAATIASSSVSFVGANTRDPGGAEQRQAIERQWPLREGQRFTQSAWSGAKSQGLRTLQARRYPLARIDKSLADIDADTHKADVSVAYAPGPAYTFGPLRIEGAERYDAVGTARIARLAEGKEYDQALLLDAQQRLASSGYYDSVFLTLADVPTLGENAEDNASAIEGQGEHVTSPVIAKVREAKLQKWVFGVGMSTDTGPRLSVDHTHNKLPWLGWRAVTKLQLEKKNPLLSTQWTALPDENLWRWFTGAKAERAPIGDYNVNSAQLRAGRTKAEDRIDRNYYLQYDYAKNQGVDAPPASSSITANYGWTGRYFDSNLLPTSGYGFAWEVGAGTTLTPERTPFGRLTGRWLSLIPMDERDPETKRRSRLALRLSGGSVIAREDAEIPMTQLFITGGDNTVRGYGYQSIGARSDNGQVIGGRYMAVTSVEWQRPIVIKGNTQDWEHALFVDAGTVGDRLDSMYMRVGVGTGIRWRSPVGPLQADLAWGVQDKRLRLHLRMGFNF